MLSKPYKRLTRSQTPKPLRVTGRDVALVRATARFRALSSDQLAQIDGGSPRGARNRLSQLFDHGYLDRFQQQHVLLGSFFDEGNAPLIYGLAKKGARLLAEQGDDIAGHLDWTTKNARAKVPFLAHTMTIADAILKLQFALKAHSETAFLDHHELPPFFPEATQKRADPFRLSVTFPHDGRQLAIGVVPDRLMSFVYPDNTRHNFALEIDMGTADVWSNNLRTKSSIRKKLLGYFHAFAQRRHQEVWGFHGFRVLTLTVSESRIQNMLKAQKQVTGGLAPSMFLYSTSERIAEHGILGPAWTGANGDGISLLPSLPTSQPLEFDHVHP